MEITRLTTVLDAADLGAVSSFWADVLGGTVDADDDWHSVVVDGRPVLAVQLAPDHVPPQWPDGSPPQQIHLDVHVPELGPAHEEVLRLGGRLVQAAEDTSGGDFQVYTDPAGHPFCLCW